MARFVHPNIGRCYDLFALLTGARVGGLIITCSQAILKYNHGPLAKVDSVDDETIAGKVDLLAYVPE